MMNSVQKLLTCALFGLFIFTYSCKDDDDDPVGCNYLTATQDELNAVLTAQEAWTADPSNTAKCEAFIAAYQDYLVELEAHIECATISGQQAELQSAIDQTQATLDSTDCQ